MSLNSNILKRFARQIRLSQIGELGQGKLCGASVLVIGAGGLGCPALQYLAGAGIGKIGVMDFDTIELSNLHRQLLFDARDIGKSKAEIAAEKLHFLAPESEIVAFNKPLDNAAAVAIFPEYDLILDGTDQVHIRYLINDACRLFQKPWVYGAVNGFQGQWAIFSHHQNAADYRDVFPVPPNPMTAENCELTGTLAMVPGQVGIMQALEAVKYFCGLQPNENTVLYTENLLDCSIYSMDIARGEIRDTPDISAFLATDYLEYVLGFYYNKKEITNGA